MQIYLNIFIFNLFFNAIVSEFTVPDATVETFKPRGLRVSIPHVDGMTLFAFHGKINAELEGFEAGTFSRDVLRVKNGKWIFWEPTAKLKKGDILYFWTYADYNGRGYPRLDQEHTVEELIPLWNRTRHQGNRKPMHKPNNPQTSRNSTDCLPTITTLRGKPSCSGDIIFQEPFNVFRPNVWTHEIKFAGRPDYEFVVYENRPEVINVTNDQLRIRPVLTEHIYGKDFVINGEGLYLGSNCTGAKGTSECFQKPSDTSVISPVVSALITTKHRFYFTYGKIEITARLPRGNWIYPQLYLLPRSNHYGPFYESGAMRIAFLPGNTDLGNILYGGCIFGHSQSARSYGMKEIRQQDGWTSKSHKFWLKWTNESIIVGVDNFTYARIEPPEGGFVSDEDKLDIDNVEDLESGTKMAPFDHDMYIAVGVGVGGVNFPEFSASAKLWSKVNQKTFYSSKNDWISTWGDDAALIVEDITVRAL